MAKKIRFPLKMKNGAEVRTLDELKASFDLESVLGYFTDGKLTTWLADRYYDEKAEAVSALSADTPELNAKLCNILEVEYQGDDDVADLEYIQRRNEKLRILSAYTDNKDILNNIDIVAMSQDELFDILDEQPEKVYLYGEKFSIPFGAKNVCYIGVNNPVMTIDKTKYVFEYNEAGISFKNIRYDDTVNPYVTRGELLYLENRYKEAFPLVKEAAESGNPRAMYIMARYYQDGYEVVKINKDNRNSWCERAYPYKESLSMYGYAAWCINDSEEKKRIYLQIFTNIKEMAESGDVLALGIIGVMYICGIGGERNNEKAVEWYKKAAEHGNADAQYQLGVMYYMGWYVEGKDYAQAIEWYRKAAEQGNADAQHELGVMYSLGYGIEMDRTKAVEWYRKAAEQGNADAQLHLGDMYFHKFGAEKDYAQAIEWYRKAAERGETRAQNQLGLMYELGAGVSQDKTKAVEWYKKAAAQGSEAAIDSLKNLGVSI